LPIFFFIFCPWLLTFDWVLMFVFCLSFDCPWWLWLIAMLIVFDDCFLLSFNCLWWLLLIEFWLSLMIVFESHVDYWLLLMIIFNIICFDYLYWICIWFFYIPTSGNIFFGPRNDTLNGMTCSTLLIHYKLLNIFLLSVHDFFLMLIKGER